MRDYLRTAAACGLLLAGAAPAAEAQDTGVARSFEQLVGLVRPGDTVSVIDTTGTEFSGRIQRVSDVSLALLTEDGPREWSEAEVRTIRQRGDSLKNGALIGLVGGAALGILGGVGICNDPFFGGCDGWVAIGMPAQFAGLFGAIGAGIGVGIDALNTRPQVIYDSSGSANIFLSPVVTQTRRGVLVSLSF